MAFLNFKLMSLILLFSLSIQNGFCEPHCSKFHYEEKLLEKMIRLEIKLEQMETRYKDMENAIKEERNRLQKDRANMLEFVERAVEDSDTLLSDLKDEMKSTSEKMLKDVQDATSALETSRHQNEATLTRLAGDLRTFQNETLKDFISQVKIPDVFFKAKDLSSQNVGNDEIFKFKTILQNRGEGYDTGSGIFTAPVSGDYLFTAQMCNAAGSLVALAFVVDDVLQPSMVIRDSQAHCGTLSLMMRVNIGARVGLKSTSSSKTFKEDKYEGHSIYNATYEITFEIESVKLFLPYIHSG